MKVVFRKILELTLKLLSKAILFKYKPMTIGITGSIGKTSAKEAIATVLAAKHRVRGSQKNYNNEIGLPLTIIGADSGGRSFIGWGKVFFKALGLLFKRSSDYPEALVLEMGIDKPGDIDYLLSIVKLNVAVLTYIGHSHLENFGSQKKLSDEKAKIFKGLVKNGFAILNYDNEAAREQLLAVNRRALTYGLDNAADVRGADVLWKYLQSEDPDDLGGVSFKLSYRDSLVPMHLSNVLGEPALYAALAAAAVGLAFGLNGLEIAESLNEWQTPPGRMKLIKGINGSLIIDDTYNAAPQSTLAALNVLDKIRQLGSGRKWAVLGDMKELGQESETGHRSVGARLAAIPKARLVFMGQMAHHYAVGARQNNMPDDRIMEFNHHQEIIDYLESQLGPKDLLLIKGSQSMRMEKVVKGLMAEPETASKLLVRQGADWSKQAGQVDR